MIEIHKFCLVVGELVASYSGKRLFLIHNSLELALVEPNQDKVIYYVSQYRFLLDMYNDKVF